MMSKVLKVMIIAAMLLVATGALFAAKPEVLTIHLTVNNTVPSIWQVAYQFIPYIRHI